MWLCLYFYIEVASRATGASFALAAESNAVAVIDTSRDIDFEFAQFFDAFAALTGTAGILNNGTLAFANRTSLLDAEKALLYSNLPLAVTVFADNNIVRIFSAFAIAVRACC